MDLHQRAWVKQLYREYDAIIYHFGLPSMRAVLQVEPLQHEWGRWDPNCRTITLAIALIEQHSWDVVVEVLKHEMAHQWSQQHAPHDAPHGTAFASACRWLGVAAWAARCQGPLPMTCVPGAHYRVASEEQRLLDKVDKLLNLATSSNEHEAALAMQRARHMMARYNLQRGAVPPDDESMTYVVVHRHRRRIDRIESMVVALLVEYFHVQAIYTHAYDKDALCEFRAVELLGERRHVAFAEYVYHFLLRTVDSLYAQYRLATTGGRAQKQAYQVGVLLGFGDKLQAQDAARVAEEPASPQERALVKVAAKHVQAYVTQRHPKLKTRSTRGRALDASALQEGKKAGQHIVLRRAIAEQAASRGRLLGQGGRLS